MGQRKVRHKRRRLQGWTKVLFPGLVNFVAAVGYYFCLALPAAFTQPGTCLLAELCSEEGREGNRLMHREESRKISPSLF